MSLFTCGIISPGFYNSGSIASRNLALSFGLTCSKTRRLTSQLTLRVVTQLKERLFIAVSTFCGLGLVDVKPSLTRDYMLMLFQANRTGALGHLNGKVGKVTSVFIEPDMGITMGKLKPSAPPYTGPAVHYQFVNMQVTIGQQMTLNTTPIPVVISNAETYYPALTSWYVEGFKLLSFYRIPGQIGQAGLFNMASNITFQGIMCRDSDMPDRGRWQLCIEKSVFQVQALNAGIISMQYGVHSDTSHILQTIALKTQGGGRLLCIGMTGQQGQNLGMAMSGLAPPMGVDLFFEIPNEPMPEQYVYTSVSVPINARFQLAGIHRTVLAANCDWKGNLASNLSQGWRLIEIFMDLSTHINTAGHRSMITYNSLWFFEKPASRVNDPTPMYEGRVILHDIRTSAGIVGAQKSASWEPVIHDMGNDGWELACIVETPDSQMPGMSTMIQKCVLFFQRPLFTPATFQVQTVHDGDATSGKG